MLGGRGILGFFIGLTSGIVLMTYFVLTKNDFMSGVLFYMAETMKSEQNKKISTSKKRKK